MNFNFDRMSHLAGTENKEKQLLLERTEVLSEADESRIRKVIREELEAALHAAFEKREQKGFDTAVESKTLAQAVQFAAISKYGKIHPDTEPAVDSYRPRGAGFIGGLGFH